MPRVRRSSQREHHRPGWPAVLNRRVDLADLDVKWGYPGQRREWEAQGLLGGFLRLENEDGHSDIVFWLQPIASNQARGSSHDGKPERCERCPRLGRIR